MHGLLQVDDSVFSSLLRNIRFPAHSRAGCLLAFRRYLPAAKVLATPAVRRLCREMSIDLSLGRISGTGPGGRVLKGDVLAYAAKEPATSRDSAQSSSVSAVVADGGAAGQQPRQAGHYDLDIAALRGLREINPSMVFHSDADRLGLLAKPASGSVSEPVSEPVSRPAGDWSNRSGPTATDSAGEAAAAGVRVVEEEQRAPAEKEPRRASGTRGRKEPVLVPIKGGGWDAATAASSRACCRGKGEGELWGNRSPGVAVAIVRGPTPWYRPSLDLRS